jgi:hypothetical protein
MPSNATTYGTASGRRRSERRARHSPLHNRRGFGPQIRSDLSATSQTQPFVLHCRVSQRRSACLLVPANAPPTTWRSLPPAKPTAAMNGANRFFWPTALNCPIATPSSTSILRADSGSSGRRSSTIIGKAPFSKRSVPTTTVSLDRRNGIGTRSCISNPKDWKRIYFVRSIPFLNRCLHFVRNGKRKSRPSAGVRVINSINGLGGCRGSRDQSTGGRNLAAALLRHFFDRSDRDDGRRRNMDDRRRDRRIRRRATERRSAAERRTSGLPTQQRLGRGRHRTAR